MTEGVNAQALSMYSWIQNLEGIRINCFIRIRLAVGNGMDMNDIYSSIWIRVDLFPVVADTVAHPATKDGIA